MLGAIDRVAASTTARAVRTTVPAAETSEIGAGQGTLATDREAEGTLPTDLAEAMSATSPAAETSAEEEIGLDRGTLLAVAIKAAMHSEEAGVDLTDRELVPIAIAALQAWAPAEEAAEEDSEEAEEEVVAEAEAAVAGGDRQMMADSRRSETTMKSTSANGKRFRLLRIACAVAGVCFAVSIVGGAQQSVTKAMPAAPAGARGFDTPKDAADALITAAEKFDESSFTQIFGPEGKDIVASGEPAQDREKATQFAARAREKETISVDPKTGNRAFLLVGNESWPFPVPLVKVSGRWYFDAKAGQKEMLYRRIGANELDAIAICRGYVEAQYDYAMQKREGYDVNQYAQRIISTKGKQDGLAWQNADGSWEGPVGEKVADAIERGYSKRTEPYHGYFFKVLKGQGPAAPLGKMDYVVKGAMIGGFALMAAPAEYRVTGVKTFIVSNDGVVYQKDLGPNTLEEFQKTELFNPDRSWTPVPENVE